MLTFEVECTTANHLDSRGVAVEFTSDAGSDIEIDTDLGIVVANPKLQSLFKEGERYVICIMKK